MSVSRGSGTQQVEPGIPHSHLHSRKPENLLARSVGRGRKGCLGASWPSNFDSTG